jgi:alpha-glucosidase
MLENLGLSGFAFSGADVGGYAGSPTPELLTKWIELGAFQPIDRDHAEKGTVDKEPWTGGPEQEAIRRRFIEARYQLMPYLYTLAEEASRTGLPMLRPLFLEFPDAAADRHPIDTDNAAAGEFLLGGNLLIAPPPYPEDPDSYSIEFPSSGWYNYWTGEKISYLDSGSTAMPDPTGIAGRSAPLTIRVAPALDQLPVFVRGGSILPIAPIVQSTNQTPQGPLTLRIFVGDHCAGELYLDDGNTFAYQHGVFLKMKFSCERTADGLHLVLGQHLGSYRAWWKEIRAEIYGWTPTQGKVFVQEKAIPVHLYHDPQSIGFVVADDGLGADVEVK